jgi:hypothetical protein
MTVIGDNATIGRQLVSDVQITQELLARLLREAEEAHGKYETQLGHRDDDWPTWYAAYIVSKLQERQEHEPGATQQR